MLSLFFTLYIVRIIASIKSNTFTGRGTRCTGYILVLTRELDVDLKRKCRDSVEDWCVGDMSSPLLVPTGMWRGLSRISGACAFFVL